MKIVMTGGHHSSALPVIAELKRRRTDVEIHWFGHIHSLRGDKNETLEYKEITQLQIPFYEVKTAKIYGSYNPLRILRVLNGVIQAVRLLSRIQPELIMSFGGYLAVPVVLAAFIKGIPILTHEQTLVAGYANRLIGFFASKVMISWETSEKYFNRNKTVYTGIPLREEIFRPVSNEFAVNNHLPTILVLGGKSGSHAINDFIIDNLATLLNHYNIIHQCGDYSKYNDFERGVQVYSNLRDVGKGVYIPRKFIFGNEIGEAYSRASVVVSRAGAHSVAELAALKKPAILIPISWVSHNEQYENAKYLSSLGKATIVSEADLRPDVFLTALNSMLSLRPSLTNDSNFINDAAKRIADEIEKYIKTK